jgi:hypothetical protein
MDLLFLLLQPPSSRSFFATACLRTPTVRLRAPPHSLSTTPRRSFSRLNLHNDRVHRNRGPASFKSLYRKRANTPCSCMCRALSRFRYNTKTSRLCLARTRTTFENNKIQRGRVTCDIPNRGNDDGRTKFSGGTDAALSYQQPLHNLRMVTPRAESSSSNCTTPGEASRSPGTMTAHSRFSRNSFDVICHCPKDDDFASPIWTMDQCRTSATRLPRQVTVRTV